MIVIARKHSYFIKDEDVAMVEAGSMVFDPENNKLYMAFAPGELTEIGVEVVGVETLEALVEAIAAGGAVKVVKDIDAPTAIEIKADTVITNDSVITVKEDTIGDGVFKVTAGTLTLNGQGTVNGLGANAYSMAVWATENGKVIINDGHFTNIGASSNFDSEHFDLIYASGNGQIEINGGEFECETPAWILNIKDKDRETASIVVKGGKFHGFNPADCASEGEHTNFVAPGYKVIEEDGVFVVMPE